MGRKQGQGAEVGAKAAGPGLCHPSVSPTWEGKEAGEPQAADSSEVGGGLKGSLPAWGWFQLAGVWAPEGVGTRSPG